MNRTIPTLTKFSGTLETNYVVDGVTYEYPRLGIKEPGEWYVWFEGKTLDIVVPAEFGLEPGNDIAINAVHYTIDSVIVVRSKKGILTVI